MFGVYAICIEQAIRQQEFRARRESDKQATEFLAGLDWSDRQLARYQDVVADINFRLARLLRRSPAHRRLNR